MDVVILGAGSHGSDLFHICQDAGLTVTRFLDDNVEHLDNCARLATYKPDVQYLIGINSPDQRCQHDYRHHQPAIAIHPSVHVGADFRPEPGVVIAAGCIIGHKVTLGRHVHINHASSLIRCTIGDYTTIAPGVDIAGDVTIGTGVFVGIGARISNLVTIGNGATIGAGAVVVDDVEENDTVVGVPARSIRMGLGA